MSFQYGREPFKPKQPRPSAFTRLAEARREWDQHVKRARERTFARLGIRER